MTSQAFQLDTYQNTHLLIPNEISRFSKFRRVHIHVPALRPHYARHPNTSASFPLFVWYLGRRVFAQAHHCVRGSLAKTKRENVIKIIHAHFTPLARIHSGNIDFFPCRFAPVRAYAVQSLGHVLVFPVVILVTSFRPLYNVRSQIS